MAGTIVLYGLSEIEMYWMLRDCDYTKPDSNLLDPKGFWRVDKDKDPELRHTVLTLIAFRDLLEKIDSCGGDRDKGIELFCNQNDGEGWMIPNTLRLADYGLGHDDRAKEHQPVASRLGPRFYDWQLEQDPKESWKECELHARNILGEVGFNQLMREINQTEPEPNGIAEDSDPYDYNGSDGMLFTEKRPLLKEKSRGGPVE